MSTQAEIMKAVIALQAATAAMDAVAAMPDEAWTSDQVADAWNEDFDRKFRAQSEAEQALLALARDYVAEVPEAAPVVESAEPVTVAAPQTHNVHGVPTPEHHAATLRALSSEDAAREYLSNAYIAGASLRAILKALGQNRVPQRAGTGQLIELAVRAAVRGRIGREILSDPASLR